MDEQRIRVLICDDHAIMRGGLRRILAEDPGIDVIGEAASSAEVVAAVQMAPPDVLLMDLSLPDRDGISTIKDILSDHAAVKVLVLTMHDAPSYVREAFAAGATGYVVKTSIDSELIQGVRDVAAGKPHIEPRLGTAVLLEREAEQKAVAPQRTLTERETTVLQKLAMGYTNQEIADELHLSVRTIETYRARIQNKTDVRSRSGLVQLARDWGLIG